MKNQMKCFKKAMKGISKRMDSLGDRCQGCDLAFDNTDADALSTWVVYVVDGMPNVICPDCKKEIDETKQQYVEEEKTNAGTNE
jgi:hypothetical protein